MVDTRTTRIPVFITHAWRFHDDWNRLVRLMEQVPNSPWVNYSVPWYDPAIRVHSEAGKEKLASMLLAQILPSKFVIFLCGPYAAKSSHDWFDMALDMAIGQTKTILLLPGFETQEYIAPARIADARRITWDLDAMYRELSEDLGL